MGDSWSAMSDPTRRKILQLLKNKDMNAGEIADCFNMTKPSISHHLNILNPMPKSNFYHELTK